MKNLPEKIYLSFGEMSKDKFKEGDYKEFCEYHNNLVTFNEQKFWETDVEYIRKDALVKYLYEEKGYPITLNGELVHWDELTKHFAEYNKWEKDAFIEKTEDFIRRKICDYIVHYNYGPNNDMETMYVDSRFFEDFKNYMKEE